MGTIVGLDEEVVPQEIDLVIDTEQDWIDKPEMEQMHGQE